MHKIVVIFNLLFIISISIYVHSKVSYSVFLYKNLTLLPQTPRTKCANIETDIAFSVYIDYNAAISDMNIKQFFIVQVGHCFPGSL